MVRLYRRVVLQDIEKEGTTPADDLLWLCKSIGIIDNNDETCGRVFQEIVQKTIEGEGVTTRELCSLVGITRAAVIYHLKKLEMAGLITKRGHRHFLRRRTLAETLEELDHELDMVMKRVISIARTIDMMFAR